MNNDYIKIEDVGILGCLVPPGTGWNDVTQRFIRHFLVLPFTLFDQETQTRIFNQILNYFQGNF